MSDAKLFGCTGCNTNLVKEGLPFLGAFVSWKKEVKFGSQKEMFFLCCMTDLPWVKEKRPGLYNNVWCDKCIRSYQLTKDSSRPSHAKVHKIDNASVQKHVRWIFVMFYLINFTWLKYKTMYIKYIGRQTILVVLVTEDSLD